MNQKEFENLFETTVGTCRSLLVTKGAEYAGSVDRLANFKRGSGDAGVSPLQVALIYWSKHVDSIKTYIRNDAAGVKQVLSEPIEGRFDDAINYLILMKALVVEGGVKVPVRSLSDERILSELRHGGYPDTISNFNKGVK